MLRLALLSARGRLATFTGALIALTAASVLATAWGMQLESILRSHTPVERYAAAAAVVTGEQRVGTDHDVFLSQRNRVSSALTARLAAVPGVRAAVGDVSLPARLGATATYAHGWGSAALTPYVLSAGRAPAGPGEVVTGYPATLGTRLAFASTERVRTVTVVGVARARHPVSLQTAIFLTDAEAARLAGHPGRVDAVGVLAGPGVDVSGLRAARVPPTLALTDAAVEPRLVGPGRIIGGLLALAGAVPLFAVSTTTSTPETAAATSELTAICLVVAVGFLGPIVARLAGRVLGPPLAAISPVGGFLASANLGTATRVFSSATTPLVLTVALSCTLLFSTTTIDHAVAQQKQTGLTGELAITSSGAGLPATALTDARATPGVRSAVALTSTALGPR